MAQERDARGVPPDDPIYVTIQITLNEIVGLSRFFLTFTATPWLDGKHTIFGEVIEGGEVLKALEAAGTDSGTPKERLVIEKVTVEEK